MADKSKQAEIAFTAGDRRVVRRLGKEPLRAHVWYGLLFRPAPLCFEMLAVHLWRGDNNWPTPAGGNAKAGHGSEVKVGG